MTEMQTTPPPDNTPDQAARIPLATYRLQFNRAFPFAAAARLVPYLHALGISDCYASPYFKAVPGSPHGYDVVDHGALNPELGDQADYAAFVQALRQYGLGQLLDIVPNHMGIADSANRFWLDVLENGPSSRYAPFFDIDWSPVKTSLSGKVLLPILDKQYGQVLENQELRLCYEDGRFFVDYYNHRLPIAPRPTALILTHRLGDLEHQLGPEHTQLLEFRSLISALNHLPLRTETSRERILERNREKTVIQRRLASLTNTCPHIRTFVEENVRFFNGSPGKPRSFDLLDSLLEEQPYRLAYWRVAAEEINYRRFFDINELAAVRTEDLSVFAAIHSFVLQLVAEGQVTGLRIDHIDGLYDPAEYVARLQQAVALGRAANDSTPAARPAWQPEELVTGLRRRTRSDSSSRPCYIVAEKILAGDEELPESWPIHGSTGYDFLALLNGLFVAADNAQALTTIYARFARTKTRFADLTYETKKLIMQVSMASEIHALAQRLDQLSESDRTARDFTLQSLTHALREVIACFPVYRTYIDSRGVAERDRTIIDTAIASARRRNPAMDSSIFEYIRHVLLLRFPDTASADYRRIHLAFVMAFQQCTGPVMAKGVEDTAFYRYQRLVSLNEVGGDPAVFGVSRETFHAKNRERAAQWPHTLLSTSTHDTKRSEDVRARINVLSELPEEWQAALTRWKAINSRKRFRVDGHPAPDRNDEYLLYQTLVGVWPLGPMSAEDLVGFGQRIGDYMRKASKEAKVHTSWINPNHTYDDALQTFVQQVLGDPIFVDDFCRFQATIAQYGMYNALSQTLLKLTVPGVPDIYQGTELWDFSLVDPDNRRPVDYPLRRQLLEQLTQRLDTAEGDGQALCRFAQELLASWTDGRIKLYVTHRSLTYRRTYPQLFLHGGYAPLDSWGAREQHVCAFARQHEQHAMIVVAPRLLSGVAADPHTPPVGAAVWSQTWLGLPDSLGARSYRNVLTGEVLTADRIDGGPGLWLGDILAHFPVALLEGLEG